MRTSLMNAAEPPRAGWKWQVPQARLLKIGPSTGRFSTSTKSNWPSAKSAKFSVLPRATSAMTAISGNPKPERFGMSVCSGTCAAVTLGMAIAAATASTRFVVPLTRLMTLLPSRPWNPGHPGASWLKCGASLPTGIRPREDERSLYQGAFRLLERGQRSRRSDGCYLGLRRGERELREADPPPARREGVLDDVEELANVAEPGLREEEPHRFGGHAPRAL